jgi:hypothetical protein
VVVVVRQLQLKQPLAPRQPPRAAVGVHSSSTSPTHTQGDPPLPHPSEVGRHQQAVPIDHAPAAV